METPPLDRAIAPANITGSGSARKADPEKDRQIKKACADFEAMLVYQMLKAMRQTIPKSGLVEPSQAKGTYDMLLDQKIADEIVRKGQGLGLQKMLYQQITRHTQKPD